MNEKKLKVNDITFGLITLLDENTNVSDIRIGDVTPVSHQVIEDWEERHGCKLPNDLNEFYRTTNGLSIQWCAQFSGRLIPVGCLEINSIYGLTNLKESLIAHGVNDDIIEDVIGDKTEEYVPSVNDQCFILHSDSMCGKVVLALDRRRKDGELTDDVWLLDRSFQWNFLAPSFTKYLRMNVFHMAIRGWQYAFTNVGLPPDVKKWFHFFLPRIDGYEAVSDKTSPQWHVNEIDFSSLFKHKTSSKKRTSEQAKQKMNPSTKQNKVRSNISRTYSKK